MVRFAESLIACTVTMTQEQSLGLMQEAIYDQMYLNVLFVPTICSFFVSTHWFVLILLVPVDFWDSPMFSYFCSSLREEKREHSYQDKKKKMFVQRKKI